MSNDKIIQDLEFWAEQMNECLLHEFKPAYVTIAGLRDMLYRTKRALEQQRDNKSE